MRHTCLYSILILFLSIFLIGSVPAAVRAQEGAPGGTLTPHGEYEPIPPVDPFAQQPGNQNTLQPGDRYDRDATTDQAAPGSPVDDTTGDRSSRWSGWNKPMNYTLLKGGIYSPSTDVDVGNIDFGKKAGGAGELAVGHYFLPMLAVEIGAGYFQSKDSPAAAPGTLLRVVPIVATGKVIIPLGIFEPYGLFGIGGYISDLDVRGGVNNFSGSTEITFGLHAGAGFNIDLNKNLFVGAEGKYLWAKPEFGGRPIRLDGFITTLDVGFRF